MADVEIINRAVTAAPKDYLVSEQQEILLKTVTASIDGSGAGGAFVPALQLLNQNGDVLWSAVHTSTVAAGASADVTWFPGVKAAAAAAVSGQGTMICTTTVGGTSVTVPAGTTRTLSWDEIVVDGSGTFSPGTGHGNTWSILKPGQYQLMVYVTATANWPAAGSGPIVLEVLNPDTTLDLLGGAIFDTDGSNESPLLMGMCSTGGGSVPARVRVALKNTTAFDFSTQPFFTFMTMSRLGDEVDF